MHGFTSSFPAGGPGAGLLLLRLAVATRLLLDSLGGALPLWWWLLLALLMLLLGLGLLTPLAAAVCAVYQALSLFNNWSSAGPAPAVAVFGALALLLLGPGAYALDARLFGRRRLLLPKDPFTPDS